MILDKFKKYLFEKVYKEFKNTEVIIHNNGLFMINTNEKNWFLQYKNGILYWKYDFFMRFFRPYSLEENEFEKIIVEWFSEKFGLQVKENYWSFFLIDDEVKNIILNK